MSSIVHTKFDKNAEISIEQMLNSCDLSSLISQIPRELLSVRLHTCSIRVKDGELVAFGKPGSNKFDRFLLLHRTKDSQHGYPYTTLINIHHKQFITSHKFGALQQFGTGDAQHCYVYLDAKQPLLVDWHVQHHIKESELKHLSYDPFPESTIIRLGSHFFTIKQQKSMYWTSALDCDVDVLAADDESHDTRATKRVKLNDTTNDANKFNIPLAVLTNPRCSTELAQHVLEFLSISDVVFGINMLEHAQHDHAVLLDDKWWKRRLAHEFGSRVTRWSDDVLRSWQQQWLEGKPWLNKYQYHKQKPVTDVARQHVMSQPLWFSAAVHFATRLGRFAREMLYQTDNDVRMPAAMRYVLTISPPFQLCGKYLMKEHAIWSRLKHAIFDDEFIVNDKSYSWFAQTEEREEHTLFIALYTGISYVISDDNTATLGEAVALDDNTVQIQDQDWQVEEHKDEEGCSIREVKLTDPDLWPVIEWEAYQRSIYVAAPNLHEYFIKRGVYRHCDKLISMWDEHASTTTPHDERAFEWRSSGNGSDEEHVDNNGEDEDDVARLSDPHPSFAPAYRIRFSNKYMSSLVKLLDYSN